MKTRILTKFTVLIVMSVLLLGAPGFSSSPGDFLDQKVRDEGFILKTVANELNREIAISISITDLKIDYRTIGDETYAVIDIDEAGKTYSDGQPLLPMIGQLYQISDTLAPVVEVMEVRSHEISLDHPVLPSQFDREDNDIVSINDFDWYLYSNNEWYPESNVHVDEPIIFRDVRALPVAYYPVRYNPVSNTLRVVDEATIIIRMTDAPTTNILQNHGPYSPSFEILYQALIPNYSDEWAAGRDRNAPERYLFVMPDAFEARCQGYFAWKEQQGFIIDILRLSSLGTNPTYTQVKNAIQAYYDGFSRPTYVTIIGSTNNFPVHTSHDTYMSGDFDDDLFYSQLNGTDLLPDTLQGRFPAVDPDELSLMLSRSLFYEQNPDMTPAYYKTALMACSGLYSSQQTTKEQTAARLTTDLGYSTIHTMYNWTSSSVSQIQGWVNQGVSIINYRGEGWQAGWHPGHAYDFEYPQVYPLQNGNKFPVVTSIGCGVAMFDGYTECFGHAWMTIGSPGQLRGAVAFMGPTWNTRTTINNWIDRGIYRGFCYHNVTRSAAAYAYGKVYAYTHFLGTPYMTNDIPTHMREYVHFGSPDIWWRTDIPREASIYHAWCPGSSEHGIVVIDNEGKKVANAQVSFLKDGERRVYVTDGGGGSKISMDDITEPIGYTLTGWNLIPSFGQFDLPDTGDDGDLLITEVKPDITTTGLAGDKVEIANLETELSVNLKGWTLGDLDGYEVPFIGVDAVLGAHQIAVIELVGPDGPESVQTTAYGLLIKSKALVGLSSLEDTCVLRNTTGRIRDGIAWHNGTGVGSTDEANDLSKLTQPTSPLSMGVRGWYAGPDVIPKESYELYAINWTAYAGEGGVGSIQRIGIPGAGVYDSPAYFSVAASTNFGSWSFPSETNISVGKILLSR